MARLYEYAVIYNPKATKEQQDKGETPASTLVVDVTRILANNDKEAQMIAARAIPGEYMTRLDRVEVAIRPF